MTTITNSSYVTDYSGEPPIVTFSNPVTTVIRQTPPAPIITRFFYNLPCNRCNHCNRCDCCWECSCQRNCCCNNCCRFNGCF